MAPNFFLTKKIIPPPPKKKNKIPSKAHPRTAAWPIAFEPFLPFEAVVPKFARWHYRHR